MSCLDDRITLRLSRVDDALGGPVEVVTIRYPGNLDLRFDVTPLAGVSFAHTYLHLDDLKPVEVVNTHSVCRRDDRGHIVSDSIQPLLVRDTTSSAQAINDRAAGAALPLPEGQTLHLLAQHGSNQLAHPSEGGYTLAYTEGPKPVWRDPMEGIAEMIHAMFAGLDDW